MKAFLVRKEGIVMNCIELKWKIESMTHMVTIFYFMVVNNPTIPSHANAIFTTAWHQK
jgi:hypothetical protein